MTNDLRDLERAAREGGLGDRAALVRAQERAGMLDAPRALLADVIQQALAKVLIDQAPMPRRRWPWDVFRAPTTDGMMAMSVRSVDGADGSIRMRWGDTERIVTLRPTDR